MISNSSKTYPKDDTSPTEGTCLRKLKAAKELTVGSSQHLKIESSFRSLCGM